MRSGSTFRCCARARRERWACRPCGPSRPVFGRKNCVRSWESAFLRRPRRSASSRSDLPDFPGRLPARPFLFERTAFAHRVHRTPVPLVLENGQLAFTREAFERFALQDRVRTDVIERLPPEDEKAAVDPALVELGLLAELLGQIASNVQLAEATGRPNARDRRELPLLTVEFKE